MSPRVVYFLSLVLCLPALSLGCAQGSDSAAAPIPTVINAIPPEVMDDGGSTPAAVVRGAQPIVGSPLCNASLSFGCYPDDPTTAIAKLCGVAPDAGAYDASGGYDNVQLACRVTPPHRGVGARSQCGLAGTVTDGMSCSGAADCAAGYECISDGTCRHYCCAGVCTDANQFCDIQAMAGNPTNVPVCMPIQSCGLLDQPTDAGSCARTQTCVVVRENGATSCVDPGIRHAGEECDTQLCARGLVCLGKSGDRHCYVLCHTAHGATECASTSKQMCKGGLPLFPVPGIGICE